MTRRDDTSIGGSGDGLFHTTHWTSIVALQRQQDPNQRRLAMERLLKEYWKPIYCYLCRKGLDRERAKDLTQDFIANVILGRDLVARADRAKGRFRAFLCSALKRYWVSATRSEMAQKRLPAGRMVAMDAMEAPDALHPVTDCTPDQAFVYAWASSLLDAVLAAVRDGCCRAGQMAHWEAFHARIVGPIMEGTRPPALPEVCAAHGIKNESIASNMIVTVRRRFRRTLWEHVRQMVGSDQDVDAEIQEIMQILSSCGAGA